MTFKALLAAKAGETITTSVVDMDDQISCLETFPSQSTIRP